jgi:hypothetical protein
MGGEWLIHRLHAYAEETRAHERKHNRLLYTHFRSELCTRLVVSLFSPLCLVLLAFRYPVLSSCRADIRSVISFSRSLLPPSFRPFLPYSFVDISSNISNPTKASTTPEPSPCSANAARLPASSRPLKRYAFSSFPSFCLSCPAELTINPSLV